MYNSRQVSYVWRCARFIPTIIPRRIHSLERALLCRPSFVISFCLILSLTSMAFYMGYKSAYSSPKKIHLLRENNKAIMNMIRLMTMDRIELFEKRLIGEKENIFAESEPASGPLDAFGLKKRFPKTSIWIQEEFNLTLKEPVDQNLISPVGTSNDGMLAFQSVESLLRHIYATLQEHQRFLVIRHRELMNLASKLPTDEYKGKLKRKIIQTSSHSSEYSRRVRSELEEYMQRIGYTEKSHEVLRELREKLRNAIRRSQSNSCEHVVKYNLTNVHGFSSGIHEILRNLVQSFIGGKRLSVDTSRWHYLNETPWASIFQPLNTSENCANISARLNDYSNLYNLPKDIAEPLIQHHDDPYAWWLGQFMGYIMRPSSSLQNSIDKMKQSLQFRHPIVGLHIRRTDKASEAAYQPVEAYMAHVEEFFLNNVQPNESKRIYVATDELTIIDELQNKFPEYVVLSNRNAARMAGSRFERYSEASLHALLVDMFILAETDQLVCTFSSGFCRVVYELMHSQRDSFRVISLDVPFYFAYLPNPPRVAIHSHDALEKTELYLNKGGYVCLKSNDYVVVEAIDKADYDGFTTGRRCGSKLLTGLYPLYKTLVTVNALNWTTT